MRNKAYTLVFISAAIVFAALFSLWESGAEPTWERQNIPVTVLIFRAPVILITFCAIYLAVVYFYSLYRLAILIKDD